MLSSFLQLHPDSSTIRLLGLMADGKKESSCTPVHPVWGKASKQTMLGVGGISIVPKKNF